MRTLIHLLALLALAGCGGVSVGTGEGPAKEERFINGIPVVQYYQAFHYKKSEGEDLPFHYLSNSSTKLKKLEGDKNLYFTASIFLFENNTYTVDYDESVLEMADSGIITLTSVFKTRVKGTWKIEDMSLVLDGLGKGTGATVNDQQAFVFAFDRAINTPELKGKADFYYYTSSNQGYTD